MLRWSPRHTKHLKDPLLILALHQRALAQLLSALAPYDVLIQASLIESHPFRTSKQAHATVENVVPILKLVYGQ